MFMEKIKTHLVPDPKTDEQKTGKTQGQTGDIDEGIAFLSQGISLGGFKVVVKHMILRD
jgi:hypothetical protein